MSDIESRSPVSGYSLSGSARRSSPAPHGPAWSWLIIWSICLTVLSLLPLHIKRAIRTTGTFHDAGHLVAFAITTVLFLRCIRLDASAVWRLWPVLMFALALEVLEAVLYGNVLEWSDIGLDTLGMFAGLLAYCFTRAWILRSQR